MQKLTKWVLVVSASMVSASALAGGGSPIPPRVGLGQTWEFTMMPDGLSPLSGEVKVLQKQAGEQEWLLQQPRGGMSIIPYEAGQVRWLTYQPNGSAPELYICGLPFKALNDKFEPGALVAGPLEKLLGAQFTSWDDLKARTTGSCMVKQRADGRLELVLTSNGNAGFTVLYEAWPNTSKQNSIVLHEPSGSLQLDPANHAINLIYQTREAGRERLYWCLARYPAAATNLPYEGALLTGTLEEISNLVAQHQNFQSLAAQAQGKCTFRMKR